MVQAIVISEWKDEAPAIVASIPRNVKINVESLTNLFDLHEFKQSGPNYQEIDIPGLKISSFFSGGNKGPFIIKENFCVFLILSEEENTEDFKKPLRKLTNNLLINLEDVDFTSYLIDIFNTIKEGRINDIKIERNIKKNETPIISEPSIKTQNEEVFDDLLATLDDTPTDNNSDLFSNTSHEEYCPEDPFGSNQSSGDLFGTPMKSEDLFNTKKASIKTDVNKKPSLDPFGGEYTTDELFGDSDSSDDEDLFS